MSQPVSVRFRRGDLASRVKREAVAQRRSTSALIEELVDEGLRSRRHPLVSFRNGPTCRRAVLVGGPDVWEVVDGLVGGDVPAAARLDRAHKLFGWPLAHIQAAVAYYGEFPEEIDAEIDANRSAGDEAEAAWRRGLDVLAR
jgi:hypothetical protein